MKKFFQSAVPDDPTPCSEISRDNSAADSTVIIPWVPCNTPIPFPSAPSIVAPVEPSPVLANVLSAPATPAALPVLSISEISSLIELISRGNAVEPSASTVAPNVFFPPTNPQPSVPSFPHPQSAHQPSWDQSSWGNPPPATWDKPLVSGSWDKPSAIGNWDNVLKICHELIQCFVKL